MIIRILNDVLCGRDDLRLPRGGAIDRLAPIPFRFNGVEYQGYRGDTLASALLANGVRLVGRSFKYHRPRGVLTAGSEEPNALVELRRGARREPNSRATTVELFPGLEANSQNCWPHVGVDLLSVNQIAGPLFAAGFYYKTFMGAGLSTWMFCERWIRRAAGLGRAPTVADPDRYERAHRHCDLLVVGAGPAGLMAAATAAAAGLKVILLDEQDQVGGRLRGERLTVDGGPAADWAAATAADLVARENVTVLTRTTAFGVFDDQWVGAVERVADHLPEPAPFTPRQRYWKIKARRILVATGAIERPLVFAGNDRPGVMLAGAVRTYVNRFAVAPGRRAVVFTNNDDGYRTALDHLAAGIEVNAVVDPRPADGGALAAEVAAAGVPVLRGHVVTAVEGGRAVVGAAVMKWDAKAGQPVGDPTVITCDHLAMSGGWDPVLHLMSQNGAKAVWDDALAAFRPGPGARGDCQAIGAAQGDFDLAACLAAGAAAGAAAATDFGTAEAPPSVPPVPMVAPSESQPIAPLWRVPPGPSGGGSAFIDPQHDVTAGDIAIARRENYISVEHLKRYTTLGMATDQGKLSNVNGLALLAAETERTIPATGTTTFRAPFTPVAFGAFVGRDVGAHEAPQRRSAMHGWHLAHGGVMVDSGGWARPQYYLEAGESADDTSAMDRAIIREVQAVRTAVGMVDVSTLGKIDIQGGDAAEFLNRVYINGWSQLAVGKARYGLMLRPDGLVADDGTTSRLAEKHFLMTTTTANAGKVMAELEWHLQVVWPDLDVKVASVTEQWAAMALAGPHARAVLRAAAPDLDFSDAALPFMGVMTGAIAGVPVRVFRISFSGELSYEINAPADFAAAVWAHLMAAGAAHDIRPYGTEAMAILRIEKGHPAGPELNGQTTADDLGMGRMMSGKKPFIGQALAGRPGLSDPARPKLVGLVPVDGRTRPLSGAHLVANPAAPAPNPSLGWISSSAYLSPTLGHPIALGFLAAGPTRLGDTVWAVSPLHGQRVEVKVVDPVFLDPEGARLKPADSDPPTPAPAVDTPLPPRAPAVEIAAGDYGARGPGRPMVRLSLRGNLRTLQVEGVDPAAADALARQFGQALPETGQAVGGGDRPRMMWSGPDRWLIVAPDDGDLPARVAAAVGAGSAAVVDLSHSRAVIRIRGAVWREILAKGTAVDLDPSVFGGEQTRLTALFHVPVTLDVRDDGAAVDIFAARSLAPDLWAALTDAAGEFGYRIA